MLNVLPIVEQNKANLILLKALEKQNDINLVRDFQQGNITVIIDGPCSELTSALQMKPSLKKQIDRILFVGGSDKYGDITPVAEKNVYSDVYGAQYMFLSEIPIVMFGLNVTRDIENRCLMPLVYLKDETIFESEQCGVFVETKGQLTFGMTVTDLYSDKQFEQQTVQIIKSFDKDKYQQILQQL